MKASSFLMSILALAAAIGGYLLGYHRGAQSAITGPVTMAPTAGASAPGIGSDRGKPVAPSHPREPLPPLAGGLAPSKEEIASILTEAPSPARDRRLGDLFVALGRKERGGAMEHLATLTGRNRDLAQSAVLIGWSQVDPRGAWDWAVEKALRQGVEWTDAPTPAASGSLLMLMAEIYKSGNGDQLPGLVNNLPPGRARDSLTGMYTKILMQYDPDAALAYAGQQGGEAKMGALRSVGQDLSKESPVRAAQWAASLPPEESAHAMKGVMGTWVARDSAAALDWVRNQPPSAAVDSAIDMIVSEASIEAVRNNSDLLAKYSSEERAKKGRARLQFRVSALEKRLKN